MHYYANNSRKKPSRIARFWQAVPKSRFLLIAFVVNFSSLGVLWYGNQPAPRSQAATIPVASQEIPKEAISGVPVRIIIPSVGIDNVVELGRYDRGTNSWTLSGYNAHVATMMAPANDQGGNTFIYGHNNKYVFGPLKKIQPGSEVEVVTDNGHRFFYAYETTDTVSPTDVSLFSYQGPPILTVQTCTGLWDEQRQLTRFRLTRVVESPVVIAARQEERRQATIKAVSQPLRKTPSTMSQL